ncbi:MAG: hypothetical protein WBV94_24730 [Blastocatellia bacterium]
MKRITSLSLVLICILSVTASAGLGSKKTAYIGGTITSIKEGTEGVSSTTDEKAWTFDYKNGKLSIPYDKVTELEYGQKAGRRVAMAILISPIALFSKKRKHYLTITYMNDDGKQQAGVFELGKDIVRTMLASVEARTGKQIQYQDDEARKHAKGD